jgi:hypothetical protein
VEHRKISNGGGHQSLIKAGAGHRARSAIA